MDVKGNTQEAIAFLKSWCPSGPWVLTAIPVAQTGTSTQTFSSDEEERMFAWIDQRNGTENLYFMVNPAVRRLETKAKKTDVRGLAWLHVDIDPRPREDLKSERERGLRVLKAFNPPPTVVIDSGGGFQGFWKLAEEIPTNGSEERAAELEAYNIQISLLLGADQVHNLDRIMRLPGTVNLPTEKKKKKGRTAALASVVEAHWERSYPINSFTPAPRVQTKESGLHVNGAGVKLSGNLPRVASLDDLGPNVTDRVKMLIVQGDDPDDPTRYPSRSEVVFAVCCELVRAGLENDIIASILLDKDFGISGHVLAQSRPPAYAARQITRAREEAIDPHLRTLNESHAVIEDIGGKCRIITEVFDPILRRSRLTRQSFDDFRNRYMHLKVQIGTDDKGVPVHIPLGKFWLAHPSRRQYRTILFSPTREVPETYNLWRGFACEARPGECSLLLQHMLANICRSNNEYYEYLLSWMARAVQRPDTPGEIAIVLRGRMGVGKSKLAKIFGSLWGRHFLHVTDPKHLVGSFNAHLRDCVVLFADEAFYAGDKKHESLLKGLITEEITMVEAKGFDAEASPNFVHLIMASNNDWVVPAGADERRFFVLDVGEERMQDAAYFAALDREMDNGGREAFLHMLMTLDLSHFEVRQVPKTSALQDQKLLSLSPVEEWWHERLVNGCTTFRSDTWITEVRKEDLHGDLISYLERQKIMRRPSPTALGKFLKRLMPEGYPKNDQRLAEVSYTDDFGQTRSKKARAYFWTIGTLEECRKKWDERYGGPYAWLGEPTRQQQTVADKPPF